jgi:hypothetical protein
MRTMMGAGAAIMVSRFGGLPVAGQESSGAVTRSPRRSGHGPTR